MTKSFQMTKSISPSSASVSKAEQGLLEQPGFSSRGLGEKLSPVHTAAVAGSQQQGCPGYRYLLFSFLPNKAPFQQLLPHQQQLSLPQVL